MLASTHSSANGLFGISLPFFSSAGSLPEAMLLWQETLGVFVLSRALLFCVEFAGCCCQCVLASHIALKIRPSGSLQSLSVHGLLWLRCHCFSIQLRVFPSKLASWRWWTRDAWGWADGVEDSWKSVSFLADVHRLGFGRQFFRKSGWNVFLRVTIPPWHLELVPRCPWPQLTTRPTTMSRPGGL